MPGYGIKDLGNSLVDFRAHLISVSKRPFDHLWVMSPPEAPPEHNSQSSPPAQGHRTHKLTNKLPVTSVECKLTVAQVGGRPGGDGLCPLGPDGRLHADGHLPGGRVHAVRQVSTHLYPRHHQAHPPVIILPIPS